MQNEMTMDRVRAAMTKKLRWTPSQAPSAGDAPAPEKACQEPTTDDPEEQTCTTPDEPAYPELPASAAA